MAKSKAGKEAPSGAIYPNCMNAATDIVRLGPIWLCQKCADQDKFPYIPQHVTKKGSRVVSDESPLCGKCQKELMT